MVDVILETLIDTFKMVPYLLISYIIIEYLEHTSRDKIHKWLSSSGKFGSIVGALLGSLPQCGFSVTAANLYSSRVISLGTLVAVFLATSDECIPVLLSHPGSFDKILKIVLVKIVIAIVFGFLIDFIYKKVIMKNRTENEEEQVEEHIHNMCEDSHCHCDEGKFGIIKSALKHTVSITFFILIVAFILNTVIFFIGEERLSSVLLTGSIFQPLLASLIGLIPNCASSVILTELYLAGKLSFASIIAGLSAGCGIGSIILFKSNKNYKENFVIIGLLFLIGSISGILLQLVGV